VKIPDLTPPKTEAVENTPEKVEEEHLSLYFQKSVPISVTLNIYQD
jgi:hypothetical protein